MKTFCAIILFSLSFIGSMMSASAQPFPGDRYREDRYREDRYIEREYLRCNRDVRASVYRGEFSSGFEHYRRHGRREGRRLSC